MDSQLLISFNNFLQKNCKLSFLSDFILTLFFSQLSDLSNILVFSKSGQTRRGLAFSTSLQFI